eukprot:3535462-Prymnesium_polylepis.1
MPRLLVDLHTVTATKEGFKSAAIQGPSGSRRGGRPGCGNVHSANFHVGCCGVGLRAAGEAFDEHRNRCGEGGLAGHWCPGERDIAWRLLLSD